MNIDISEQAQVSDILSAVKNAGEDSHIYCSSERHFSLLKICLVKLQKVDLNIYLLDQHGFTVKQVSATKKPAMPDPVVGAAKTNMIDDRDALVIGFSRDTEGPFASPSESAAVNEQGMSSKQISVLRDLEQALRRCKEQALLVIGFSDGLVAVPEALGYGADAISSADALEVEAFDVYRGYEAEEDS
ncbi:MAG: hypothetical protein V7707_07420 [Motiliproteus sp.]